VCFETTTRCEDPSFTSLADNAGFELVQGKGCSRSANWIGCCQSKATNPAYPPPLECRYDGDSEAFRERCEEKEGSFEAPSADAGAQDATTDT